MVCYYKLVFSITYDLVSVGKISSVLEINVVEIVIVLDFTHVLDGAKAERCLFLFIC
jgi:hypothetical protein